MGNAVFQERIRRLRSDKCLSMEELAKALGIKKSRISMWENNGAVPRGEMLTELSQYFGVSVDYLLGNDTMKGRKPESDTLNLLQRNLERLDSERLQKAAKVLQAVFEDVFNEDEEHHGL